MRRSDERGSSIVEFVLVSPLVVLVTLSVIQLALIWHTRVVATAAADAAVQLAAFDGDTAAGEQRLRAVLSRDLRAGVVESVTWYPTLTALTVRVRVHVPVFVWLAPQTMRVDATTYRERWA